MQKVLCVFLTIVLLCCLFTITASANQAPAIDIEFINSDNDREAADLFFKIAGLLTLGGYLIFTLIHSIVARKNNKPLSLSLCVKHFIPVGIATLILFLFGYIEEPIYLKDRLLLLLVMAFLASPIYLFITTMLNVIRLFSAEQEDIKNYKTYVKKSLISITVFFAIVAFTIVSFVVYEQIF
jgi:hypothetical protein